LLIVNYLHNQQLRIYNVQLLMQKDLKSMFGGDVHGLDEKSLTFLVKALEKNNLPGFDYIEFKQSLHNLQAMDVTDAMAYKSAYATASTVGVTKDKLLKTAEHYKQVLSKEKKQFDEALGKKMEERVQSKQKEVEKLKKQIEEYQAKIQELESRIEKAQATIDHADEHIQEARTKIESTAEAFQITHQSILNQINQDIESINNYL